MRLPRRSVCLPKRDHYLVLDRKTLPLYLQGGRVGADFEHSHGNLYDLNPVLLCRAVHGNHVRLDHSTPQPSCGRPPGEHREEVQHPHRTGKLTEDQGVPEKTNGARAWGGQRTGRNKRISTGAGLSIPERRQFWLAGGM